MKHRRSFLVGNPLSALSLVCALFISGCAGGEKPVPPPPSFPAEKLVKERVKVTSLYPAAIEGIVNVEVRPQVDGTLMAIHVDDGAYVKAGQKLFSIDDRIYRAQYQQARADQEVARIEVEKVKPLVAAKVVAPVQLETARAKYLAAQAATNRAKVNFGYTQITAPIEGYIGTVPYRLGSLVEANQSQMLTLLSDISKMYVYFSISEPEYMRFRASLSDSLSYKDYADMHPVSLTLTDGSLYPWTGRLDAISGQFDPVTGAVAVRAIFPNPEALLRNGNTGTVAIQQELSDVITVPQSATTDLQDKIFVYLLDEKGLVKKTAITVAAKSGNRLVVSSPLKAGDVIITSGFSRLRDSMQVIPKFQVAGTAGDSVSTSNAQ